MDCSDDYIIILTVSQTERGMGLAIHALDKNEFHDLGRTLLLWGLGLYPCALGYWLRVESKIVGEVVLGGTTHAPWARTEGGPLINFPTSTSSFLQTVVYL